MQITHLPIPKVIRETRVKSPVRATHVEESEQNTGKAGKKDPISPMLRKRNNREERQRETW